MISSNSLKPWELWESFDDDVISMYTALSLFHVDTGHYWSPLSQSVVLITLLGDELFGGQRRH